MPQEVVERHPVGGNATESISLSWTVFPASHLVHLPPLLLQLSTKILDEFARSFLRVWWEKVLCVEKRLTYQNSPSSCLLVSRSRTSGSTPLQFGQLRDKPALATD